MGVLDGFEPFNPTVESPSTLDGFPAVGEDPNKFLPSTTAAAAAPPPKTWGETAVDAVKGVGAGVRDAIVGLPGVPASAAASGVWIGDRLRTYAKQGEKNPDGTVKSEKQVADEVRAERAARQTPAERSGDAFNVFGIDVPTSQGVIKGANAIGVPGNYEPETGPGRFAKGVGTLGTALIAGPGNLMQKGLASVAGEGLGTLGEMGTKALPGKYKDIGQAFGVTPEEVEKSGRLIGTAAGMGAGALAGKGFDRGAIPDRTNQPAYQRIPGKAYDMIAGPARSDKILAEAAKKDAAFARDYPNLAPKVTAAEAAEASARGLPIRPVDIAGPNTRKAIGDAARDPTGQALIDEINNTTAGNRAMPGATLAGRVDAAMGDTVNAGQRAIELHERMTAVNGANYPATMALPHAQQVWTPELGQMLKRADKSHIEQAMDLARRTGDNSIIPPVWQEAVPAVPHKILWKDGQWVETPGQPAVRAGWVPGPNGPPNLAFWDNLKKAMDDDIQGKMPVTNKETNYIRATRDLKNEMVAAVDKIVPEYQSTRGIAADMFGEANALEQGARFFKNLDTFKTSKVRQSVERMPEHHREGFAIGFAQALKDGFQNNPQATLKRVIEDPRFQAKMRVAMPGQADRIIADARAARVMFETKALVPPSLPEPSSWRRFAGAVVPNVVGGGLGHMAGAIATGAPLLAASPLGLAGTVLGPVAWGAQKAASGVRGRQMNAASRDILRRAEDPSQFGAAAPRPAPAPPPARVEPPPLTIRRKAGGRVKMNPFDAAADALIAMVEQARAGHASSTESLLQAPDEHIVHALHVASKHT